VADCCKHANEYWDCIKDGEHFDQVQEYVFLKGSIRHIRKEVSELNLTELPNRVKSFLQQLSIRQRPHLQKNEYLMLQASYVTFIVLVTGS
jgi:hypothetical protein